VPLRTIGAREFALRLKRATETTDERYALFLGSGCSVSSKIPSAASLVIDHWLPRLRDLRAPRRTDTVAWAQEEFPGYDPAHAAAIYGSVIAKLFLTDAERQREIENLCDKQWPAFGYATIAQLMALQSGVLSVALTTNFDDLIGDALYLFTEARPLVIQHDSLAPYIRATRTRPMVVKLHGDHRLSPRNTAAETEVLLKEIETRVHALLQDRGLIFIGYGGRDRGIRALLERLEPSALQHGVYWVSRSEPPDEMRSWLESRQAILVTSPDFDELMLLIRDELKLPHPDRQRLEGVFQRYADDYVRIRNKITASSGDEAATPELVAAAERVGRSFPDWWAVHLEATRLSTEDVDRADAVYGEGLQEFPNSSGLLGSYAVFLESIRKDYDGAEAMYRRALEAEPRNPIHLGNYALFLQSVRKDYDGAGAMYKRAIEAEPQHANNLGNYATLLESIRKDYDGAEAMYKRAIEADPQHANSLGNYATLLESIRKDYDGAEAMYRRAIEADPQHANSLGNYADFLQNIREDYDGAEAMYKRALEAEPNNAYAIDHYASFLDTVRKDGPGAALVRQARNSGRGRLGKRKPRSP
jgi:tetratricopeptide (TPR) repeat protein